MKNQKRTFLGLIIALLISITSVYAQQPPASPPISYRNQSIDYFVKPAPMNTDGRLTIIITTPAQTSLLNSANLDTGAITTASKLKQPAPFSLGIIARASNSEGAPIPVILLSDRPLAIGDITKGYAIGTFEYTQSGNKLLTGIIATSPDSRYKHVVNMKLLEQQFPNVPKTLASWAASNNAELTFTGDRFEALIFTGDRILDYANAHITEADRRPMDEKGNPTLLDHPLSNNLRKEK